MTVEDAVQYLLGKTQVKPPTKEVVAALVSAEKQARKNKQRYDYEQLLGSWQLRFVSGTQVQKQVQKRDRSSAKANLSDADLSDADSSETQPSRAKPLKRPGSGRFLPQWTNLSLTYGSQSSLLPSDLVASHHLDQPLQPLALGAVVNQVAVGSMRLTLSGPTRYWPNTNSLGFDFVYLQLAIGPWTVYRAPVRGGLKRAQTFADQLLKDQAFFTFFTVTPDYIAARGKGGGLALWTKVQPGV